MDDTHDTMDQTQDTATRSRPWRRRPFIITAASKLHTRAKLAREESTQVIRRVTGELAGLVFPVR